MLLLGLFVLPLATGVARLGTGAGGLLLESILMAGLRNLAWGVFVTRWEERLRLAAAMSLMLMLTATFVSEHRWAPMLAGLYVLVGCGWLTRGYWRELPTVDERPRRFSGAISLVGVLIAAVLGLALASDQPQTRSLWGFLPSSGGTRWFDAESRGGVNDGEDEARGSEQAESVGFSENDQFIDTDEPSLYDVIGELFGKPMKMREVERAIALPQEQTRRRDVIPAENLRPGREFEMRREPAASRRPESRGADAVLYVQGPAPAHLRLATYDWFDGVAWQEEPNTGLSLSIKNDPDDPWMSFIYPLADPPDFLMLPVRHTIKIAKLKGANLPTPPLVAGFRVGRVTDPAFFAWAQPGILRLADRTIPKATIFEVETHSVDTERLADHPTLGTQIIALKNYLALPGAAELQTLLDQTADEWTAGQPRGWPQIYAILQRLRSDFTHEPTPIPRGTAAAGQGAQGDPLVAFLTTSRRGQSYHFASAAVLLWRSLGYPARLATGFYVNPERWNEETGHYHLLRDDLHFWPELLVDGKHWLALEATPGFGLMPARWPWHLRCWHLLRAVWHGCMAHPGLIAGLALSGLVLLRLRLHLLDLAATAWWRWWGASDPRTRVAATLAVLERRGRWSGLARPEGYSLWRWYGQTLPDRCTSGPESDPVDRAFADLVNWALYAPATRPLHEPAAVAEQVCGSVLARWSLGRLRRAARSQHRNRAAATSSPSPIPERRL